MNKIHESALHEAILVEMDIPHYSSYLNCEINEEELYDSIVCGACTSDLLPYGGGGYVQMFVAMVWSRINQWFKDNKIRFDSYGYAKTPRKALSLVENESWSLIAEEIWEDCCSANVKKYNLNADDYKLAETEEEDD